MQYIGLYIISFHPYDDPLRFHLLFFCLFFVCVLFFFQFKVDSILISADSETRSWGVKQHSQDEEA